MKAPYLVAVLGLALLPGCELARDEVARAERNCQRTQQEQTSQAQTGRVVPARRCGLIRATCDMDRRGPACEALLERYQ